MASIIATKRCLLLITTLYIVSAVNSIDIYLNGELQHFHTPFSRYGRREFNITGAGLAIADPIDLCSQQTADFSGRIVVTISTGCSPETKIRLAQERGALALIAHELGRNGPSGNVYWKTANGQWAPGTSIGYVTINGSEGDALRLLITEKAENDTLLADLNPFEPNEWITVLDTSGAYIGVCVALIVANGAGLGFGLSRLISLIIARGCSRTTAHLALSFICATHVTTIIYFTLNVIDIRTGPVAPDAVFTIFVIFPELFQLLASLIVSLYWFELINSVTNKPMMFLNKLFKPFIAFSVIIGALYLAAVITSGLYLSDLVTLILLFVFLVLSITVAIIWIIVGAKLIHQIRHNAKLREKSKKAANFKRLSALIILCAVFLFLTRVTYLWLALDINVYANPWYWLPVATLVFVWQLATSFIQTGLFKMHKRDFKTSGATSRDSKSERTRAQRASVTGASMNMSAIASKGDSINEAMSDDNLVTERQITSAASEAQKTSSSEEEPSKSSSNHEQQNGDGSSESEKGSHSGLERGSASSEKSPL